MIHERFNVERVEQLPAAKVEAAVGYVHMMEAEFNKHIPTIVSLPGAGRYFFNVDGRENNRVFISDIEHCNIIDADEAHKLKRDLRTMMDAMADLSNRMRLIDGEITARVVEQPLKIELTAA